MQPGKITIATSLFPALSAMVYGDGTEALLLLHGFPATGNLWRSIVPGLARNYKVIVPDLPGVGSSEPGSREFSISDLAEGMLQLLEHAGHRAAVIAGHSMGGYTALAMAALAPDRVSGLSLIHSTAAPDDEEKKTARRKAISMIERGGREAFIRASVTGLFAPAFKEAHPDVVEAQINESLLIPDQVLISFYNAMMERPSRLNILQEASFPVQWIIGSADTVIPKEKALQQSSASRVSFVTVYPHCGHMSMLEDPGALAKDLETFAVYCHRKSKDPIR